MDEASQATQTAIETKAKNLPKELGNIHLSAPTESEIVASWTLHGPPVVSVCCATYNHSKYVADALNSILSQVSTFPFELIIRDDASTDNTVEILRRYQEKYPRIIKLVLEKTNQMSLGIDTLNAFAPLFTGEFMALCEGDDFWIDKTKLQKQVDLMRSHGNAVMCVAKTYKCLDENGGLSIIGTVDGNKNVIQHFEQIRKDYFHTSTYLIRGNIYRHAIKEYFFDNGIFGDTALRHILIQYGPFVFLPDFVSVYRITGTGMWTALPRVEALLWELKVAELLHKKLKDKYKRFQGARAYDISFALARSWFVGLLKGERRFKDREFSLVSAIASCLHYGFRYKIWVR
jgi:glycosyltransferase involved in cell wall biosynthesis